MVKVTNILLVLVSCVVNVRAFSNYRTTLVHSRLAAPSQIQKAALNVVPIKGATSLKMADDATKAEPKKSLIDTVWNEQTKLSIYLAVWYIGNIACKIIKIDTITSHYYFGYLH